MDHEISNDTLTGMNALVLKRNLAKRQILVFPRKPFFPYFHPNVVMTTVCRVPLWIDMTRTNF